MNKRHIIKRRPEQRTQQIQTQSECFNVIIMFQFQLAILFLLAFNIILLFSYFKDLVIHNVFISNNESYYIILVSYYYY